MIGMWIGVELMIGVRFRRKAGFRIKVEFRTRTNLMIIKIESAGILVELIFPLRPHNISSLLKSEPPKNHPLPSLPLLKPTLTCKNHKRLLSERILSSKFKSPHQNQQILPHTKRPQASKTYQHSIHSALNSLQPQDFHQFLVG